MSKYYFYCEKCKNEQTLDCTLKEYQTLKSGLKCSNCESKLQRDFNKGNISNVSWDCHTDSVKGGELSNYDIGKHIEETKIKYKGDK